MFEKYIVKIPLLTLNQDRLNRGNLGSIMESKWLSVYGGLSMKVGDLGGFTVVLYISLLEASRPQETSLRPLGEDPEISRRVGTI